MPPTADDYAELSYYTLSHGAPEFIHQHVVDATAAELADEHTKPIRLTFALAGLYLHTERHFTGREVQRAHTKLANHKQAWPSLTLPADRGSITVLTVLAAPAGPDRDAAIDAWCTSLWRAYEHCRPRIVELLTENGVV